MKNQTLHSRTSFRLLAACAMAAMFGLSSLPGQTQKGGELLLSLGKPKGSAVAQLSQKPAGCCPQCVNQVTRVKVQGRAARPETALAIRHQCPDCTTQRVASGHGKQRTEKITHTCSAATQRCCVSK